MALKPWQRIVKDPKDKKPTERVNWYENTGFVASDFKSQEYIKHRQEKKKKKLAKIAKRLEVHRKRGYNLGYKTGQKELRNGEYMKKKLEQAYNRGLKDGKPKVNLQERIAKKEAKVKAEQEKLKALKAKAQ